MYGSSGNIHRKLTRAEQKAALLLEAQEHALECERCGAACRVLGAIKAAAVLEEAARLLRRFGFGPEAGL